MEGFFFIVVAGVAVYMWLNAAKGHRQQWQSAADELSVTYYPGTMGALGNLSGEFGGHRIAVSTFTKSSGNSNQTYTRYHFEYRRRIDVEMKMTPQGVLNQIGKMFGLQDIEVGNPSFDDRVLLRGSDPDAVRQYLTPELQDAIEQMIFTYSNITITNEHVRMDRRGKDTDSAVILGTVRRLLAFCEEMVLASQTARPPRNIRADKKQPPPLPVQEADPAPAVPKVPPAIPVNPGPAPAVPVEESVEEVGVPDRVDLKQMAEELFGVDAGGSLQAAKVFNSRFDGRPVSGVGVLKRVNRFSYDPVFINAKGVKAMFEVCELADAYSKIKVSAEVMFPSEEYDSLMEKIGASLPIYGTLIAQDTLLHQFYIKG